MRKLIYILILGSLFFVPLERVEVGELLPVRAIAVYKSGDMTVLELDSGEKGIGEDVNEAYANLTKNTPSVIYMKTAEYLLVSDDTVDAVESLDELFKPWIKVCVCDAAGRVSDVAEYLDVHGELTKLHNLRTK